MTSMLSAAARPAVRRGKAVAKSAALRYALLTTDKRELPDFLIIGTKRGGTTSMWNYLQAHPLVLPMFPLRNQKSVHYFDMHYARGTAWYRSHFASRATRERAQQRHGAAPVAGDASPLYLWDPRVAERARQTLPNAKIVVLLRNPVDRAYSHWKERRGQGVEPLSFEEALACEPERVAGERERMLADPDYVSDAFDWYPYVSRGEYLSQLERWFDQYPRNQILVLRSEDFYAEPQHAVDQVTDFLCLPRHQLTAYRRFNYTPSPDIRSATRRRLEDHFRPHNEALAKVLGPQFSWAPETMPR